MLKSLSDIKYITKKREVLKFQKKTFLFPYYINSTEEDIFNDPNITSVKIFFKHTNIIIDII